MSMKKSFLDVAKPLAGILGVGAVIMVQPWERKVIMYVSQLEICDLFNNCKVVPARPHAVSFEPDFPLEAPKP